MYMIGKYDPSVDTEGIAAIYNQAGTELGVKVESVGLAFERAWYRKITPKPGAIVIAADSLLGFPRPFGLGCSDGVAAAYRRVIMRQVRLPPSELEDAHCRGRISEFIDTLVV